MPKARRFGGERIGHYTEGLGDQQLPSLYAGDRFAVGGASGDDVRA